ncbi:MAG: hypothetical protein V4726_15370 [Verrucomicrobiota bacterium]
MSGILRNSAELAAREITGLHEFFQSWFRGEVAGTEAVFSRVGTVWGPSFELIGPDSRLRNAGELIRATFDEYGRYPGLSIHIRNLVLREVAAGSVVIACYEEWHIDGETVDARLCSATLLRPHPGLERLIWMQIHESPLAGGMTADLIPA